MKHGQIKKDMKVIGADGVPVGTVDRVTGERIRLTKRDSGEGRHKGHHHYIDLGLVADDLGGPLLDDLLVLEGGNHLQDLNGKKNLKKK